MNELREFSRHNPIDDQSNFHLPIAYLQSTVANMMGGQKRATDFMIFRKGSDDDVDAQLLGNW